MQSYVVLADKYAVGLGSRSLDLAVPLPPLAQATSIAITRACRCDCEIRPRENIGHSVRLYLPVVFIVLQYAKGVDPQVSNTKTPRYVNSISKSFRQSCQWYPESSFDDGVLSGGQWMGQSPAMAESHVPAFLAYGFIQVDNIHVETSPKIQNATGKYRRFI